MAAWLFTEAILDGEPIQVFNHGDMKRDFTYIDDIVAGVIAALDHPPPGDRGRAAAPRLQHRQPSRRAAAALHRGDREGACGRKARIDLEPMQPGDVKETYADVTAIQRDLGFAPDTPIDVGIPRFVEWFKGYMKV